MRLRSSFLPFVGKTIAFFIAISVVWHFVAPTYNSLLAGAANLLAPAQTVISSEHNTIYISPGLGSSWAWMYGINGLDLQYGLLLIVALIVATPGLRLTQRLKFIPIAFVIMFIIHVVSVLVFANAANSSTPTYVENNTLVILFCIMGCDLFPVLVWAALSFKYFLPRSGESPLSKIQSTPEIGKLGK